MAGIKELDIVKELIKEGYDNLDTISFELDIPMETLREIKRKVEQEKSSAVQDDIYVSPKIEKMIRNYRNLFYGMNDTISGVEDKKTVNPKVEVYITKISDLQNTQDSVARAVEIVKKLKQIENESFSSSQIETIVKMLYNKEIFYVAASAQNRGLIRIMQIYKQKYVTKLAQDIGQRKNITTDIAELKKLKLVLTPEMEREFPLCIAPVKMQIDAKISKIMRQNTLNKSENIFSDDIKKIASKLTSEEADVNSIEEDVENEIKNRMKLSNNSKFALKKEQQKEQVFYQVGTLLKVQADKYQVRDEEKTIDMIKTVFERDDANALKTVANNYIARKEYQKAYSICDRYEIIGNSQISICKMVKILRQNIKCAEIGDIILRGIKAGASYKELENFKDVVERGLQKYGLKPSSIPLGKNKDNTREITLADIMPDQRDIY